MNEYTKTEESKSFENNQLGSRIAMITKSFEITHSCRQAFAEKLTYYFALRISYRSYRIITYKEHHFSCNSSVLWKRKETMIRQKDIYTELVATFETKEPKQNSAKGTITQFSSYHRQSKSGIIIIIIHEFLYRNNLSV